jgi:hypothetical protein
MGIYNIKKLSWKVLRYNRNLLKLFMDVKVCSINGSDPVDNEATLGDCVNAQNR